MSTNPTQRPPRRSAAPATLVDALIGAPITLRRIGDIPTPGGGPIGGAGEWIWPPWPSKRSILSHEDKPLGPPSAVQIPARPRSGGAIGKLCPESSES